MTEIPECLNRRYLAFDGLIKELTSTRPNRSSSANCLGESPTDVGIKLMCDFWNILKEDPNCNLTQAVQQRMGVFTPKKSNIYGPQNITCYLVNHASKDCSPDNNRDDLTKGKRSELESDSKGCVSKSLPPSNSSDVLPLSKAICNLKKAASLHNKCGARLNELMETENQLYNQIQHLEHKEKEGVQLLKQADCIWSCMEDTYKKKIADSLERQKNLMKQLKVIEVSITKWRKNKKDLEFQIDNINKCHKEILEKINEKNNDLKCIDMEIAEYAKRIETNKKDMEAAKKTLVNRKQASDLKYSAMTTELTKVQKQLSDEQKRKYDKEQEGSKCIKDARKDIQNLSRALLQKKLENEDLKVEREALMVEIDMLKKSCDQCRQKCKNKYVYIKDDIKQVEKEIAEYKVRCTRFNQCTDTADVRKFCTDCPRCFEKANCFREDGSDHFIMDCVCMNVKEKFLDNVFDNMYTVLEKQAKTSSGNAVAETVLCCLKNSRNGKLDDETRKVLQDFILTSVKENLNLTVVGGAVKTRCEMESETYEQLMLCLKQINVPQPLKLNKGTFVKKRPCHGRSSTSECNCPKGAKACLCTKYPPPTSQDPTSCNLEDNKDIISEVVTPHKDVTCGPNRVINPLLNCVEADVDAWHPEFYQAQSYPFTTNMRAAEYDSLSSMSIPEKLSTDIAVFEDQIMCSCGKGPKNSCTYHRDDNIYPRDRIIEEVIGNYADVLPNAKVSQSFNLLCSHVDRNVIVLKRSLNISRLSDIHKGQKTDSDELITSCFSGSRLKIK